MNSKIELEREIKKIFFEVFPNLINADFSWNKEQKDYDGWDSFAQLNLITFTEAKFDITFTLEEAIEMKSANDLLECVKIHLT